MPVFSTSSVAGVRALAAEAVTAFRLEAAGFSVRLTGGRTRGHDMVVERSDLAQPWLVDAKLLTPMSTSEQRRWPGHSFKVARPGLVPWSEDGRTHLALVILPSDAEFTGDVRTAEYRVPLDDARVHLVTVAQMNEGMEPAPVRYLLLEDGWLDGLPRW